MKNRRFVLLAFSVAWTWLAVCMANASTGGIPRPKNHWTIMQYGATDNDNDEMIVPYYRKMKAGFVDGQGVELIILADRNPGYSDDVTIFGENFSDTRLYRITHEKTERLDGGAEFPEITGTSSYEANSADARTLKKFIKFCKSHFPADKYALLFFSHGGGPHMGYDEGSPGDAIYTAEITDVLTEQESVDLVVFDVCAMGGIENAYQWRPGKNKFGARYMVASAPTSGPWAYDKVFERLRTGGGDNGEEDATVGGKERYHDPATLTALELSGVIIEEIYDGQPDESWACYDLSKVEAVKEDVDSFARCLAEGANREELERLRGSGCILRTLNYLVHLSLYPEVAWLAFPYFDLFDLVSLAAADEKFGDRIRAAAQETVRSVDDLVVFSYGGSYYPEFEKGKNGIYIFFPDGGRMIPALKKTHWTFMTWYSPLYVRETPDGWHPENLGLPEGRRRVYYCYGRYLWCGDGATPGNAKVENWFELLDSWFDAENGKDGGLNHYQW